jgi:hypothetical protein
MIRIFGLGSAEAMLARGLAASGDHNMLESVLGWAVNKNERLLSAFGRVYHSTVDEADPVIGAWQISYAMSALGTKMLLDDAGNPQELLLGVGKAGEAPAVYHTPVVVDGRLGEETLHHIEDVCREIRELAGLQLALLEDSSAGLHRARARFEQEFKSLKNDEEVGVPRGIQIKHDAAPDTAKTQTASGPPQTKKDSPGASSSPPTEKKIGGIKIIHSTPIKNDD